MAGSFIYNGIDRINNTKGYTIENCVPCCWTCNEAKKDKPYEEFTGWIVRVFNNLKVSKSNFDPVNSDIFI